MLIVLKQLTYERQSVPAFVSTSANTVRFRVLVTLVAMRHVSWFTRIRTTCLHPRRSSILFCLFIQLQFRTTIMFFNYKSLIKNKTKDSWNFRCSIIKFIKIITHNFSPGKQTAEQHWVEAFENDEVTNGAHRRMFFRSISITLAIGTKKPRKYLTRENSDTTFFAVI